MQPIADAGADRTVSYKTVVTLDASLSVDEDGPERIYQWTMEARPAGSAAKLDDSTVARPSFFTDVAGEYRFSLTVGDGLKTSAVAALEIIARNDSPVAVASPGGKLYAGTSFVLDGSASSDPNADPLMYEWAVTQRPQGSVAAPASPASAVTQFTPDIHGLYTLTLTVFDGSSASSPSTVTLDVYYPFKMIPGFTRDVAYSRALDRVVAIVPPNMLYVYDPVTGSSQSVTLSADPLAVAVSPDGLTAVVGYAGSMSVVPLQSPSISLSKTISGTTNDIVHGGNGYAYVFPTLTSRAIQNVPLTSAPVVSGTDLTIALRASLVPNAQAIYAVSDTLDQLYRLDIVNGIASLTRGVSSVPCSDVWISDDGLHIFTSCGTIYSISNVAATDMVAEGSLSGTSGVQSITQSTSAGELITVSGSTTARIYGYPSLTFEKAVSLPRMLINGTAYDGHGKFVFLRADNASFIVLEEADTGTGSQTGIGILAL